MRLKDKGRLIVISGPSGVGKSTVIEKILEDEPNICFSISATTRDPRPGEQDGVNYFFVDREEFERMIREGELLEYAEYVGKYYGTPKKAIDDVLEDGRDVLLDIEVQGALQVMEKRPDALTIFIAPPSVDTLVERLHGRGTNDEETIKKRVERALEELDKQHLYTHRVINDTVPETVQKIKDIIANSK